MQGANIISDVNLVEKYVGFADLPNQIFKAYAHDGFDLNLMVVGESGLGKSTFINNLFSTDIYVNAKFSDQLPPILFPAMEIRSSISTLVEKGIRLRLNLIDTPGYGDCIDNSSCWSKILNFIDERNKEHYEFECSSRREAHRDPLIHCIVYFLSPTGHRLKAIDVEFLKRLHQKANIILVIGRADSLTDRELAAFKKRILEDVETHQIELYQYSSDLLAGLDDQEKVTGYLNRSPFAIISSNSCVDVNGKANLCRNYKWGTCEIENTTYSDFIPLRNLILRTFTSHLIHKTHSVFYEQYRSHAMSNVSEPTGVPNNLQRVLEIEKQRQHERLVITKQQFREKLEKHKKETTERLDQLTQGKKERISKLEADISSLAFEGKSVSSEGLTNRENVSVTEEKKKKKRIF